MNNLGQSWLNASCILTAVNQWRMVSHSWFHLVMSSAFGRPVAVRPASYQALGFSPHVVEGEHGPRSTCILSGRVCGFRDLGSHTRYGPLLMLIPKQKNMCIPSHKSYFRRTMLGVRRHLRTTMPSTRMCRNFVTLCQILQFAGVCQLDILGLCWPHRGAMNHYPELRLLRHMYVRQRLNRNTFTF